MNANMSHSKTTNIDKFYLILFSLLSILFITGIALLFYKSNNFAVNPPTAADFPLPVIDRIALWFDPIFLQYNLILFAFAVGIVPFITFCYVRNMKDEKYQRLKQGLPTHLYQKPEIHQYIKNHISKTFHMRNYFGSMLALTFLIMLGCMILLLLKPLPLANAVGDTGVNYATGANFLMLGTYMEAYIHGNENQYIHTLVTTLTAFQFGFLGAYIYFIGHLVRSYFTLDLTPSVFVSSSVRMITGSILALVLCFIIIDPSIAENDGKKIHDMLLRGLPVWSFFIGFFPSRGLSFLEKITLKSIKFAKVKYFSAPLSDLPGMSYAHQIRLYREGFDNIENLATASPLQLVLRTGFSYQQLENWISQAQLYGHLRTDYQSFVQNTGISSMAGLKRYLTQIANSTNKTTDPCAELYKATGHLFDHKIGIVAMLSKAEETSSYSENLDA